MAEQAIQEVEKYCAAPADHREPDFVVGMVHAIPDDPGNWQTFASKNALSEYWDAKGSDSGAYVWLRGGQISNANITFQTFSGDWANYANYCFRPDGRIAQADSELRTFVGNIIVRRKWTFHPDGSLLNSTEQFLDLESGKPKQPTEDFVDQETPIYRTIGELPFAEVLARKRAGYFSDHTPRTFPAGSLK